jgi:hypothetical protein
MHSTSLKRTQLAENAYQYDVLLLQHSVDLASCGMAVVDMNCRQVADVLLRTVHMCMHMLSRAPWCCQQCMNDCITSAHSSNNCCVSMSLGCKSMPGCIQDNTRDRSYAHASSSHMYCPEATVLRFKVKQQLCALFHTAAVHTAMYYIQWACMYTHTVHC